MNTVPGYAISSWESGYGDMVFDLDLDTIRRLSHLPGTAMIQCDLSWLDGAPVAQSPRTILRGQVDRAAELGYRVRRHRTGVHPLRRHLRGGLGRRVHRPDAGQPVQRRLLDPGHHPGRAAAARHPQHHVRGRPDRRVGQGRVQLRPARDRVPLRRSADHGRQPRRLQEHRQGDRRAARPLAHLHGQVQRAGGQLLPHPPLAAAAPTGPGVLGRATRAPGNAVRPLHRRRPGDHARVHPAVRAEHQLLQAVRRRVVRADDGGLGTDNRTCSVRLVGQGPSARMENRVPGGDVNPYLAIAAMLAGGLHGIENELDLEPELVGNAYTSASPPVPTDAARCPRPVRPHRRSPVPRSATRSSTTTCTPPTPSWPRSSRRSPTGNGAADSKGCRADSSTGADADSWIGDHAPRQPGLGQRRGRQPPADEPVDRTRHRRGRAAPPPPRPTRRSTQRPRRSRLAGGRARRPGPTAPPVRRRRRRPPRRAGGPRGARTPGTPSATPAGRPATSGTC